MKITPSFVVLLLAASTHAQLLKVPFSSKLSIPLGLDGILTTVGLSGKKGKPDAPLRNAVVKVVTSVQTSSGQTFDDVLVDTGSAILWVGGEDTYQPGPHTKDLDTFFSVGYGAGGVSGAAVRDRVTIGAAVAAKQIIGSANDTEGFALVKPIDGILGLGPSGSNANEVGGAFANTSTPTFVETLVAEGRIAHAVFGVFIAPLGAHGVPEGTGELTFGGVDPARIRGAVTWVPQNPPLNFHWEFNVSSFSFGSVGLPTPAPARTDTGVFDIGIPFDSLFDILHAFNGTITDSPTLEVILSFPANTTDTLPALTFTLGANTTFTIPPAEYLIPKSLYASLNLTAAGGLAHTWIGSAGPFEYAFGQKWLEHVYTAYDMENHRVGFAHLA